MRLFQFPKPPPQRRRRRKKSHKWIDKAKAEVKQMPSLANLEQDILVKAAILSAAGHYSLKLADFRCQSREDVLFVQNMIWVIEALQNRYPRYLQYAKWVAIKRAVDMIEGPGKRYRKDDDTEQMLSAQVVEPSPDIETLMEDEWDWHWSNYSKRKRAEKLNTSSPISRFLSDFNDLLNAAINSNQPQDNMTKTIAVDIDGKGTFIEMTPDEYAMWKTLTKRQQPPDQ